MEGLQTNYLGNLLGGFPVIGGSINKPIVENDDKFVIELKRVRTELSEKNWKINGRKKLPI